MVSWSPFFTHSSSKLIFYRYHLQSYQSTILSTYKLIHNLPSTISINLLQISWESTNWDCKFSFLSLIRFISHVAYISPNIYHHHPNIPSSFLIFSFFLFHLSHVRFLGLNQFFQLFHLHNKIVILALQHIHLLLILFTSICGSIFIRFSIFWLLMWSRCLLN